MRVARVSVTAFVIALLVTSVSTAIVAALTPTPSFDGVRTTTLGSESTLLSRDSEPLQRLRVDMTRRQLEWTALESISHRWCVRCLRRRITASGGNFGFTRQAGICRDDQSETPGRGASTITMHWPALLTEGDRFGAVLSTKRCAVSLMQSRLSVAGQAADRRGLF